MCGIAGWIGAADNTDSQALLKAMTDVIAHRGPDAEGFLITDWSQPATRIALGHRRLSIIDLSGGRQPMIDEATGTAVVFNGEIYNFRELRDKLIGAGHAFQTTSDTEVLLRAYLQWDVDCLSMFRGMFAFALMDPVKRQVVFARDHFGKKPLFLAQIGSEVVFGSEIKSLLLHPRVPRELDNDAICDYFLFRYVPAPKTLLRSIRKLAPGSYAVWRDGSLSERSFYHPPDQEAFDPGKVAISSGDAIEEFGRCVDDAVRVRMVSDVPFGAFLSGGLDSSVVLALMARHSTCPVETFSVGFREAKYSELPYARMAAQRFSAHHNELIISEENIIDSLPEATWYRDAPVAEPSDIPILLLSREARKTVKMVLTGEGSDELLGGYPKHIYEQYVGAYQTFIPGILRNMVISPLVDALPYRFYRWKTAFAAFQLGDSTERLPRWFGAMSRSDRTRLVRQPCTSAGSVDAVPFKATPTASSLRKILYFDQTSWLPDNLLERGDRMTMGGSIEARMPFMDKELAALVSRWPDTFRVRGRTTKWILRQFARRLLPQEILNRPKVGFRVPVNEWFQGRLRDYLYDHLLGSNAKNVDYYQRPELERILRQHARGEVNHEKLLWTLLTLELWHRKLDTFQ